MFAVGLPFPESYMPGHDNNIADIVRVVHIATMNEKHWDERLTRVVEFKPAPEKPE